MARKSFVLTVVVFLLTLSGFALFIHSLNTQAIEEESGNRWGFSFSGREKSGEGTVVNTVQQQNQPPKQNWILLATDPDEGVGTNAKAIYGLWSPNILYFRVEHYRNWTTINDIDDGTFLDTDQDSTTGCPDGEYPGQNTGIGADYVIIVGWEATEMLRWDAGLGWWDLDNPISLAFLDAPNDTNVFVVGVYLSDVGTPTALDGAACDLESNWDWMPDTGHFTFDLCYCGDANGDATVNIADVVYLLNYLFLGQAPPDCY